MHFLVHPTTQLLTHHYNLLATIGQITKSVLFNKPRAQQMSQLIICLQARINETLSMASQSLSFSMRLFLKQHVFQFDVK